MKEKKNIETRNIGRENEKEATVRDEKNINTLHEINYLLHKMNKITKERYRMRKRKNEMQKYMKRDRKE
jgi:hypothetical protein